MQTVALPEGLIKKLKERAEWDGVSLADYIEQLMKKCPHPFGC